MRYSDMKLDHRKRPKVCQGLTYHPKKQARSQEDKPIVRNDHSRLESVLVRDNDSKWREESCEADFLGL